MVLQTKSLTRGQKGVLGLLFGKHAAVLTSYLCCCFEETRVLYVCTKGLRSDCFLN